MTRLSFFAAASGAVHNFPCNAATMPEKRQGSINSGDALAGVCGYGGSVAFPPSDWAGP